MTVLVTGATGTVGSKVVAGLVDRGVDVRALTRSPDTARFPDGVRAVGGEMNDPDAMRSALDGVDTVFLLAAVSPDELNATLTTLDLADRAGVRGVVYLSVIHADRFTDPPHFAAKAAAERMIAERDLPATVLRPGYYMQNDVAERERILDGGVYAPPLGRAGVLAVDVRDLAEAGVVAVVERERAATPPPSETIDLVAPDLLTGDSIADVWSELTGRTVAYGGDDLDGFERWFRTVGPGWMSLDMRLMFQRFEIDGMSAAPGTDERLRALLGRPMRSYREFAAETAAGWGLPVTADRR